MACRIQFFFNGRLTHKRYLSALKSASQDLHMTKFGLKHIQTLAYKENLPEDNTKKTPLVILHGIFGSKNNWSSLSKSLAHSSKRKIITVDARNHGESFHHPKMTYAVMAEDVVALLSSLNMQNVHILGHSMGGKTAMVLALNYPDLLGSLIVEDSAPSHSPNNVLKLYIEKLKGIKFSGSNLSDVKRAAMASLEPVVPNTGIRMFLAQNIVECPDAGFKWRVNLDAIEAYIEDLLDWEHIDKVYDKPTVFIGGMNSPYLTDAKHCDKNFIRTMFPQAGFKLIENAGHWIHSEQPNAFLKQVLLFLQDLH